MGCGEDLGGGYNDWGGIGGFDLNACLWMPECVVTSVGCWSEECDEGDCEEG